MAETVMVQRYAKIYQEFEFELPEKYPIPKGKSTEVDLLIEDPPLWAKDLQERLDRGVYARKKIKAEDIDEEISREIAQVKILLSSPKFKDIYKADAYLGYTTRILVKSLETKKSEREIKKILRSFRDVLSHRALVVVIFGTVHAKEVLEYARKAYAEKDFARMLRYEDFVDEYLSYLEPFDVADLPDKPLASVEDIKKIRWD